MMSLLPVAHALGIFRAFSCASLWWEKHVSATSIMNSWPVRCTSIPFNTREQTMHVIVASNPKIHSRKLWECFSNSRFGYLPGQSLCLEAVNASTKEKKDSQNYTRKLPINCFWNSNHIQDVFAVSWQMHPDYAFAKRPIRMWNHILTSPVLIG